MSLTDIEEAVPLCQWMHALERRWVLVGQWAKRIVGSDRNRASSSHGTSRREDARC